MSAVDLMLCRPCRGSGQMLHWIERPGGPPGNHMGRCPFCLGFGWRLYPHLRHTRLEVTFPLVGPARVAVAA